MSDSDTRAAWFCAYTPIELLPAAGLTPVRLFGATGGTEVADSLLAANLCPYVRACLQEGLSGEAPGAVVFAGCCDSMRRLHDAWSYHLRPDFSFMLDVPRGTDGPSMRLYRLSVERLASALEEYTGRAITAAAVAEAVEMRAGVDRLLSARVEGDGVRDGRRTVSTFNEAQTLTPSEFIAGHSPRAACEDQGRSTAGKPVLLTGGVLRAELFVGVIEECGGRAVAVDTCTEERSIIWADGGAAVPARAGGRSEMLGALADAYLHRVSCPRMTGPGEGMSRRDRVMGLAAERGAKGVILAPLMNCDPFLYEAPRLKATLEAAGLPVLVLKSDYREGDGGQFRTRIEAFLEML